METSFQDDPKSQLSQFCQSYCKRLVNKEDIVYTTSKYGNQYQTIVKLNCLGGQEYAGNLRTLVKEAEKEAAVQVLQAYAAEVAAHQAPAKDSSKKRPVTFSAPTDIAEKKAKTDIVDSPAFTPKVKLNSLCMKIAKRFLQKGEALYTCLNVPGGFQATVQLLCLPGDWKDRVWAGHVCQNRQQAEQSAAEIALDQIIQDPEMQEEANRSQTKNSTGGCSNKGDGKWDGAKGAGAGKGKSKGGKAWGAEEWDADGDVDWGVSRGTGSAWGSPPQMWGSPQAWNPGQTKRDLPRHRISQSPVLGEVLEWKGSYAWVAPHEPVPHKLAKARGGKVYVHKKDFVTGLSVLSPGQTVQFYVYEDGSGLGGEEVQLASG